ncbi:uncharacterized protein LOC135385420 [Ornithodoros turicata]|uniref:uncharacterized protein LOC135385420 n=1 Tax=Ornithodoros turicata TaxID=34597 RepID=UPI0031391D5B
MYSVWTASPAIATRSALREITRSVPGTPSSHNNILTHIISLPTPSSSPDEEVVRKRGKRTMPVPIATELTPPRTPTKKARSPRKLLTPKKATTPTKGSPTRSSPRKRLLLPADITDAISASPTKRLVTPFKKLKLQLKEPNVQATTALAALTRSQLVSLVEDLVDRFPDVKQTIGDLIPAPNLHHAEEKLNALLRNVYRSFPQKHWGNSRDAFCYRRVQLALEIFKEKCVAKARHLSEGEQWGALLEYAMLAWGFVRRLPDWEDPPHNKCKLTCFRSLAAHCMASLKKGNLMEAAQLEVIVGRLREMKDDNGCILPCLKFAEAALLEGQNTN